jgi:hypothetical protein
MFALLGRILGVKLIFASAAVIIVCAILVGVGIALNKITFQWHSTGSAARQQEAVENLVDYEGKRKKEVQKLETKDRRVLEQAKNKKGADDEISPAFRYWWNNTWNE